jgi:methionine-rich copper-binding protein CopC
MNWKSVNKAAVILILMIAIPEIAGHTLFDKSHPQDSSVTAAVSFVNNLHDNTQKTGFCQLEIHDDQSGSNIARVAGLESKYGEFVCNQGS